MFVTEKLLKIDFIMSLKEILSFSEEERKKILSNYGRTVKNVKHDIENIREWFKKQPHLPEIPDEELIEKFLILNKFRMEITKEKFDNYYSVRSIMPDIFSKNIDEAFLRSINDKIYVLPLPKLTPNLYRIVVTKFKDPNPDHFDVLEALIYSFYHIEIRLREDYNLSLIYIFDCEGVNASHLMKLTPTLLKKVVFISQKITTNKVHGIHFINVPSLAESFINAAKTFLNSKLADRLVIHSNMESLWKEIPLENLPRDFGGKEKSLDELNELWKTVLIDYLPKIIAHRSLYVNEQLRTKKSQLEEHLGIAGNFRQLSLD